MASLLLLLSLFWLLLYLLARGLDKRRNSQWRLDVAAAGVLALACLGFTWRLWFDGAYMPADGGDLVSADRAARPRPSRSRRAWAAVTSRRREEHGILRCSQVGCAIRRGCREAFAARRCGCNRQPPMVWEPRATAALHTDD